MTNGHRISILAPKHDHTKPNTLSPVHKTEQDQWSQNAYQKSTHVRKHPLLIAVWCAHAFIHTCLRVYIAKLRLYIYTHTHAYKYTSIYICMYTYIHIYIHTYTYTYIYATKGTTRRTIIMIIGHLCGRGQSVPTVTMM